MSKQKAKPVLIMDQIEEARERHRKTGKRQHLEFSRQQFLLENPGLPPDPRMAFSERFILDMEGYEEITAKELREICQQNPDHPLASQKRLSVSHLAGDHRICVLKDDLASLREGFVKPVVAGAEIEVHPPKPLILPDEPSPPGN